MKMSRYNTIAIRIVIVASVLLLMHRIWYQYRYVPSYMISNVAAPKELLKAVHADDLIEISNGFRLEKRTLINLNAADAVTTDNVRSVRRILSWHWWNPPPISEFDIQSNTNILAICKGRENLSTVISFVRDQGRWRVKKLTGIYDSVNPE